MQEQVHETRMIRLGNTPHLPSDVRQWLGDSRGHWEGNTLVVETTNFTDEARGSTFQTRTRNMKLVERFTRVSDRTIATSSPCPTPGRGRARGPRSCRGTASTG